MAARSFKNQQFTLEGESVKLFARFVGGGDDTNPTGLKGKGIASVAQIGSSGSGTYDLVLTDKYNGLLGVNVTFIDTGTADDWEWSLLTDLASNTTLHFQFFKGGSAADLPTTLTVLVEISLSNSKALPQSY